MEPAFIRNREPLERFVLRMLLDDDSMFDFITGMMPGRLFISDLVKPEVSPRSTLHGAVYTADVYDMEGGILVCLTGPDGGGNVTEG